VLGQGQSVLQKTLFAVVRTLAGSIPGPVCVMSYRSSFFGTEGAKLLQQAMRNQEHWSKSEVELFAAFVSKHNECAY